MHNKFKLNRIISFSSQPVFLRPEDAGVIGKAVVCAIYGIYVVLLTLAMVYSSVTREAHQVIHQCSEVAPASSVGHDISAQQYSRATTQHVTPSSGK